MPKDSFGMRRYVLIKIHYTIIINEKDFNFISGNGLVATGCLRSKYIQGKNHRRRLWRDPCGRDSNNTGTDKGAIADADGFLTITGIPDGPQTIVFSVWDMRPNTKVCVSFG